MENNYINEENIRNEYVPNKPVATKKAMLFIAICSIVPFLLSKFILSLLSSYITTLNTVILYNGMVDFIPALIRCILILIFGFSLTRQSRDAIHFIGIFALGNALSEIGKGILRLILETIFPVVSNESGYATVQTVLSIVSVIATLIFSYLLYNRIIGKNTITPVSPADHSKIKIQMIKAYICIFILTIILSFAVTIPSMLYVKDKTLDIYNNMTFFVANAINAVTLVFTFVVLFLFGYKLKKSRADGLKFAACYYLPQTFTVCISLLLSTVTTIIENDIRNDTLVNMQAAIFISVISLVVSVLLIVVTVLLVLIAIKHFFPKQEIEFPVDFTQNMYDFPPEPTPVAEISEKENEQNDSDD